MCIDKLCIARVLGNYNLPRSSQQSRIKELEEIIFLEKDMPFNKVWVLNRIFDLDYKSEIKNILDNNNFTYYDIPFSCKEFKSAKDKCSYYTNINAARNFLIKKCLLNFDFVFCLDGDCFFNDFLFNKVFKCLSKDLNKPYYAVMAKRLIKKNNDLDYSNPIDSEPMIVFTKKSKMFFNESIAFGANDKNELCWDLGFSKKEMSQGKYPSQTTGDLCRVLGDVFHISCSDQSIETNLLHRINLRKESKINTIEIIKKLCH